MTFPSIVPSPAPSNSDKLLKGSIRPDLESLILECGENTAYGICLFFLLLLLAIKIWEMKKDFQFPRYQTEELEAKPPPPPNTHSAAPDQRTGWE